jgi:uncharacterized protein YlxW (UPF0749 family)
MKKQIIIFILAGSIMACSLFLIFSFKPASSAGTSSKLVPGTEQSLQSQINELSKKISACNTVISQLQSQKKTPGASTDEINALTANAKNLAAAVDLLQTQITELQDQAKVADSENLTADIDTLQTQVTELQNKLKVTDVKNLSAVVDSLQTQVKELQKRLKIAETTIGTTPVTVNGLSVIFITNDIEVETTGSTSPSAAQFAIKIVNTTGSALTNIDVTGTITSSENFSEMLASGYPQLIDGAGLCSYVFFMKEAECVRFEAFGNAKTSLSIPIGSSITLRPKISLLAAPDEQLPPMTFNIALETLSYDKVAAK